MATPQRPDSYSPGSPDQPSHDNAFDQSQNRPASTTADLDRSNSVSHPEDYYRPLQPQLSTTDMNSNRNSTHTGPVSPVSPADSQAPIMPSNNAAQSHYPPPPSAANEYQPVPGTPGVQDHRSSAIQEQVVYAPPPPIGVNNYRTSMGVVNGEIGGSGTVNGSQPVPITPLTPGLKTSTYKEEAEVQKYEEEVRKFDKKDLAIKLKIRLAKVLLRSVNTICSLVVLALVASTVAIFNATKHLPPRNNLPPWAVNGPIWPQIVVIVISSISLVLCLGILFGYWRGGHNRAEKVAVYWTLFGVASFIFAIVMWAVAAGIMQGTRNALGGSDIWGWACRDNQRRRLFQEDINYKLVCRQQDWVLVCAIIEICIEALTIGLYMFAFWRLSSKARLRKSMDVRDKARNELWLAKLKEQQAAEAQDPETAVNTAYNQLNSNSAYIAAEEGRAVPTLQAPPSGHYATTNGHSMQQDNVPGINVTPPASGHPTTEQSFVFPPPPSRESQQVPPTPRSVSFQTTPGAPLPGQAPHVQ